MKARAILRARIDLKGRGSHCRNKPAWEIEARRPPKRGRQLCKANALRGSFPGGLSEIRLEKLVTEYYMRHFHDLEFLADENNLEFIRDF